MFLRALLVVALVAGCGPQPWSLATSDQYYRAFVSGGFSPAQASCVVQGLQKRFSEDEWNQKGLKIISEGRPDDQTAAMLAEVGKSCR